MKHQFKDERELDEVLTRPPPAVLDSLRGQAGTFGVLGAGGKMGFQLCCMLRRGLLANGQSGNVLAISRFSSETQRAKFEQAGIHVLPADLSDTKQLERLPEIDNLFFLAGVKFGTSTDRQLLQLINVETPRLVAERYCNSRIVALSTGCVYSFVSPESGGSTEESDLDPPGDYAQSCLGREQAFRRASEMRGNPCVIIRLNYANEPRYGVLVDIALRVFHDQPVVLDMGYVNVIWHADALAHIIQALPLASSPARILNVTGPDILAVRAVAEKFAQRFDRTPQFNGREAPTAWLSNAAQSHALFGQPTFALDDMLDCIADWIKHDHPLLGKPTHFEVRSGDY